MSVKCSIAMCQVCHAVITVNYGGEKSLWKTVKRFLYSFYFIFILFVGPCEGPTMKCVCPVHPPTTTTTHHPPTTLSSEIEICTSDSPTPPNPYIF